MNYAAFFTELKKIAIVINITYQDNYDCNPI